MLGFAKNLPILDLRQSGSHFGIVSAGLNFQYRGCKFPSSSNSLPLVQRVFLVCSMQQRMLVQFVSLETILADITHFSRLSRYGL